MVAIPKAVTQTVKGNGKIDDIQASDVTRQHVARLSGIHADTPVRDLLNELVDRMGLNRANHSGVPITYRIRLEREGRHLFESEIAGEALQSGDRLTLSPNIDAG